MDEKTVRQGNTQSAFDDQNSNLYMLQFIILAVLVGYWHSQGEISFIPSSWSPWVVGGVVFIGSMIVSFIPMVGNLLAIGFAICWGLFGYSLMESFDAGDGAKWTVTVILGMVGGGLNLSGMRWSQDI